MRATTPNTMNTTWVSRTIPEDRPSEQELLGDFFNSETFDDAAGT